MLLADVHLEHRLGAIEQFTKSFSASVFFIPEAHSLVRHTLKVSGFRLDYGQLNPRQALSLTHSMDLAWQAGLVHGDLNRKNVLFEAETAHILDWEPALFQLVHEKPSLMATHPWIDPEDIANNRLTVNTDLLGVYNLLFSPGQAYFRTENWCKIKHYAKQSEKPFSLLLSL